MNELCPRMMAIGMTYEQYWYGDVRMTWAFLEADRLRKKDMNYMMWIQGSYVYEAIARLIPMFKFGVKHPKNIGYVEKPYQIFDNAERKKEDPQYAENERIKAIMFFKKWAKDNSKH